MFYMFDILDEFSMMRVPIIGIGSQVGLLVHENFQKFVFIEEDPGYQGTGEGVSSLFFSSRKTWSKMKSKPSQECILRM